MYTKQARARWSIADPSVCLCPQAWDGDAHGGKTVYMSKEENEVLIETAPRGNTLALVYHMDDTFKFTKYINSKAPQGDTEECFFDLNGLYYC